MKTLLIILVTLFVSQWLYVQHGPRNPVARLTTAATNAVAGVLDAARGLVR